MSTLKNMVKQKRIKILILIILLCIGIFYTNADNLPKVVYYASNNTALCIASEDARESAIAWIYPFGDEKIKTESYFVPKLENKFNVNFDKDKPIIQEWKLKNWLLSDGQSLDAILDIRWEGFPTLTSNKEFSHTNEASQPFTQSNFGFSVLANKNVEILLCEGWNHMEYPFYYINIGGNDSKHVYFQKYNTYPKTFQADHSTFATNTNILSGEDWKTFFLTYTKDNGYLELLYIKDKEYIPIIYNNEDKKPLKPLYFLTRSFEDKAKWKFHNNYYLYTNKSDNYIFGPTLETASKEICISLYVALCDQCVMEFYLYNNHTKQIIQEVKNDIGLKHSKFEWKEVKILKYINKEDNVQFFVTTKFDYPEEFKNVSGFWAIDNIRVCTENELKISSISSQSHNLNQPSISCQLLKYKKWRPTKQNKPNYTNTPILTSTATANNLTIKWPQDSYQKAIRIYKYQGIGVCSKKPLFRNIERDKSSGYINSDHNEIIIADLVPFTIYEVSVMDPVFNWSKTYNFTTLATDKPLPEELPNNMKIDVFANKAIISWNAIKCNATYGKILYEINVLDEETLVKTYMDVVTVYTASGLNEFTNYTVEILVARDYKYLHHKDLTISSKHYFTTLPGVAEEATDLEVYASDLETVDLRYGLPLKQNGVPTLVKTTYCYNRYTCKTIVSPVAECLLWDNLYCIHINTIKVYTYTFSIQLKNNNTNSFGKKSTSKTVQNKIRGPGAPMNVEYKMVNCSQTEHYCHLNISWKHPFNPISMITQFDIELKQSELDDMDVIKDVYKISKYQRIYSHIIRYISYSTSYNISVRSSNNLYKSTYATITAVTDNIGDHINQKPILTNTTSTTVTFSVPELDSRLDSYLLTVIVQDSNRSHYINEEIEEFAEKDLCTEYGDTWIAIILKVENTTDLSITIGNLEESSVFTTNNSVLNKELKPHETYCFTFVIKNKYRDNEHVNIYHLRNVKTDNSQIPFIGKEIVSEAKGASFAIILLLTLLILLILVIGWFGYRYSKNTDAFRRRGRSDEHIYVSLDDLPTSVSNATYDKLIPT